MSRSAKIAALVAILGMAGICFGTAIVLSRSCCSADCEKCPVSFCKDSNADLAKKIVSSEIAPVGTAVALRVAGSDVALIAERVLEVSRSGFVRPMRN